MAFVPTGAKSSTKNGPGTFYTGSPIATVTAPASGSRVVDDTYFGMTINNLGSPPVPESAPLTPFPPFKVSTLRFWDVAYWAMLEPSKGQFDWSKMDNTIAAAKKHGVSDFIFVFGRVPQWASTNPTDPCKGGDGPGSCAPPNLSDFDAFATNVIQRYCGTVRYYETWNEPNNAFFWDGSNQQLLTVAQHLYQIAKSPSNCGCSNGKCNPGGGANPNQVLLPSISNLKQYNLQWIDSFLAAAGPSYLYSDLVAFHGYETNLPPESIADQVQQFATVLNKHGVGNQPLWNTEASWGMETSPVGEDQASWLMRYQMVQAAAGVSRFVWYGYDNCYYGTLWSVSPCGKPQKASDELNAAGAAYSVIQTWLEGATVTRCERYENGLWACELKRDGGYDAWMVWSSGGSKISVPVPKAFKLSVYRDWHNNVHALPAELRVDQVPVLVENHTRRSN